MWNRDRSTRNALDKLLTDAPPAAEAPAPLPAAAAAPEPDLEAQPAPMRAAHVATQAPKASPSTAAASTPKTSVLGPTLKFKGDLVADEDLVVQGRIEGSILHSRSLTVGPDGTMIGDIRARRVVVEGLVEGDVYALESVSVRATAEVAGSLYAPRVSVMEGAVFNGRVEMHNAPTIPQPMLAHEVAEIEMSSAEVDDVLSGGNATDF